jgi:acyl-coenzyme A synthetase/AMP-(fatty) acid ligase
VLELCQRHPPTVLYASPYHFKLLAKDASGLRLDAVRLALSTASALQPAVATLFRERFGIPLGQALGIIEVGLPALNLARAADKPGSLGQPLPDYEIRLLAEDGGDAPGDSPERSGELAIRGPGLFDAYLDPWTPARELVEPHGFRTGDQAWRDADGDLHLAGRRASRINVAGMKFFAEEVEAVLEAHPGVRASRVSALPHEHLGDVPVAAVVPEDPAAPPAVRDLLAHCRERLEAYKVPRRVEIVAELPLTETGKVRRSR